MLDAKMIRSNPDILRTALENRQADTSPLDEFLSLDESRRKLLAEVESLKAERNKVSEAIAVMKKEKKDASSEIERMRSVGEKIKELDAEVKDVEEKLEVILLNIPNIPGDTVPIGKDASDNVIVREWGEKRQFDFEPIPHWELATALDILDFERGSKLAGSGFILYKGLGARLERALINWMIDLHVQEDGYTEVFPPFVVNRKTITGTGQVPKFEFDMYRLPDDDMFLIPTAEVPVTNIFAEEILEGDKLPIRYTAYTPCFRREAGSAGKDTRGLLRVHQFDKVEMVNWTKPEESYDALETMTNNAEKVFKLLGIPYRILLLCTGDMGFSAAKTYDVEVWAPGVGTWLEVSSCSNCEDFQARRANIRFRRAAGEKPEFVHTLNGSGVALPRTVVAILENYQQPDGTIIIPEVLRPYMGTDVIK